MSSAMTTPASEAIGTADRAADGQEVADMPPGPVDDVLAAVMRKMETQRMPTATYRVQLNAQCTFRDVAAVVPYLYALGISDLYASPFLKAQPGSTHGYDIVDHGALNPEIGTAEDLSSLRSALREHDMGLIADIVPNHMSASPELNRWWLDVLENGPSSAYAPYFDIDWMPLKPDLADKVLLPVLGDQFGRVLEEGRLVVRFAEGSFWLEYFEHRFPISPRSYSTVLSVRIDELQRALGDEDPHLQELLSILTSIRNLPPRNESDSERLVERRREKEIIKRRLHELVERSPAIAAFVTENVRLMNGRPGEPRSFDRLDEMLQDQAYRLAYWRVASDEINYRRFFDINDLAAICTEMPQVFAESHAFLFELLDAGTITGLRIDHPDGLYDPLRYLSQLQEQHFLRLCRQEWRRRAPVAAGADPASDENRHRLEERLLELWRSAILFPGSPLARPLFIVVEKILGHGESLPDDWPVHGTVGYEFLNAANGLFVDSVGEKPLSSFFARFTRDSLDFDEIAYQCKRLIVRMSMASEINVLGYRLDRISERNRWSRDLTLSSLTRALQEVAACFDVYRTYVQPGHVLERDVHYVEKAVARAKRRNPAMSQSIFDFVRDVLLLRYHENSDDDERQAVDGFAGKFQQVTAPIVAKAVEDTAFYRYNRLISLNEVGGEPKRFGTKVPQFHRLNESRLPRWPHSLNSTTTHDTKRSEDVRARIDVLSEVPAEWQKATLRWSRWHGRHKAEIDGTDAPSRNAEHFLYQTLVGIWPGPIVSGEANASLVERIQTYMLKVVREAKVHTSWISPHEPYEAALSRFVAGIFADAPRRPFLRELDEFAARVADHGRWNSLSQLVLKIGSPGVADLYQGTELWSLTLVDPDNRQPVDLARRRRMLDELLAELAGTFGEATPADVVDSWLSQVMDGPAAERANRDRPSDAAESLVATMLHRLLDSRADGRVNLFATLLGLRARRRCGELLTSGEYLPLGTTGRFADRIVAFARRDARRCVVVVVPRLTVKVVGFGGPPPVGNVWGDTGIVLPDDMPRRTLRQLFTRGAVRPVEAASPAPATLAVAEALREFPVAMLFT